MAGQSQFLLRVAGTSGGLGAVGHTDTRITDTSDLDAQRLPLQQTLSVPDTLLCPSGTQARAEGTRKIKIKTKTKITGSGVQKVQDGTE